MKSKLKATYNWHRKVYDEMLEYVYGDNTHESVGKHPLQPLWLNQPHTPLLTLND